MSIEDENVGSEQGSTRKVTSNTTLEAPTTGNISASGRWKECFKEAIRYYYENLDSQIRDHTEQGQHSDRPTTARGYFRERGWTDATIENAMLGYAPPGDSEVAYLRESGYSRDELLSTGLFDEQLQPRWNGRYVFPYFDRKGNPVYAISRCTGANGGGAKGYDGHPADSRRGKYDHIPHSKVYVQAEEPIFGLHTLEIDEPLVITEGIADAISVHQAGYPCLSPVTTRFSRADREKLLALLKEFEVSRVYVIQDSERAWSKKEGDELDLDSFNNLHPPRVGTGLDGALQTASFLSEEGITAFVNTPPRNGLDKVDLHDYLIDGWGSLETLLSSARPVEQHPAYTKEIFQSYTPRLPPEPQNTESHTKGGKSELYDLTVTDIANRKVGFRSENPLGHIGDSRDYFVVYDDDRAFDFKRWATYNARTYLVCKAGERSLDDTEGEFTDREIFVAWKEAKKERLLHADDPIPRRALRFIVLNRDLCERNEIEDGWKLPRKAFNDALEIIQEEYGLEPGREPLERPLSSVVTPYCDRDQLGDIDIRNNARQLCQQRIERSIREEERVLIVALPAMGKSYGAIRGAAKTGTPITVFAPRHELYEENRKWCEEFDLTYYTLPAFDRDCPTAKGEYGSEWEDQVLSLRNTGVSPHVIHSHATERFGRPLPCTQGEDCPYLQKWQFDPSEFDVLIGHYTHAYKGEVIEDRIAVFDESPDDSFVEKFDVATVSATISEFLDKTELPFSSFTELIEYRHDPNRRDDALEWFNDRGINRDEYAVLTSDSDTAHALAPLMTYAILVSERLDNEWEHASFDTETAAGTGRVAAARSRESGDLFLLLPPSLDDAKGVIGLDGTPSPVMWQLAVDPQLEPVSVLDEDEKATYLRDGLGLQIVQTSDAAKHCSSGKNIIPESDAVSVDVVRKHEGVDPTVISSQEALDRYREEVSDIFDLIPENKFAHYGDLKGSNRFEGERVAVILGCRHFGDGYVKRWGAFAGKSVELRSENRGLDTDYGPFGNEVFHVVREGNALQALMRFGRDTEGANVYVHTGALPDWVPLTAQGDTKKWYNGMTEVLSVLAENEENELKAKDIAADERVSVTVRQVREHLHTLREYGHVERRKEGRGDVWRPKVAIEARGEVLVTKC